MRLLDFLKTDIDMAKRIRTFYILTIFSMYSFLMYFLQLKKFFKQILYFIESCIADSETYAISCINKKKRVSRRRARCA